jgi:tyrosyl-tRNA synthetase
MDKKQRTALVERNTEEIVTAEELDALLEKKNPHAYIGYATTGQMHVGHLMPMVKVMDFLDAGFKFTFLTADLHSFLDDQKTPWQLINARSKYYEEASKAMLSAVGANAKKVEFARGSDFELDEDYTRDVLHLAGEVTLNRVKRAASEVVRFKDAPKLSGFIYPLMQCEDVKALKADVAFGGIDQRGIYMLSRELLPLVDYAKPVCVFTPLLPSLAGDKMGGKMSASEEKSKINITSTHSQVDELVNNSFCPAKQVKNNWVLMYFKNVVFPVKEKQKKSVTVKRPEKYGGDLAYNSFDALEKDFASGKLHPLDAKKTLAAEINDLLEKVRNKIKRDTVEKAYPKSI